VPRQGVAVGAERVRDDRVAAGFPVCLMDGPNHVGGFHVQGVVARARLNAPGEKLRPHRTVQQEVAFSDSVLQSGSIHS